MRKEVVVAIGIGFALGLLITAGVWWVSQQQATSVPTDVNTTPTPTSATTPTTKKEQTSDIPLSVVSPAAGAIISEGEVEVTGKTAAKAAVVLVYPEGETIVESNEAGQFNATVALTGGTNEITVTAYDYQGNNNEVTLTVVYSTAKI